MKRLTIIIILLLIANSLVFADHSEFNYNGTKAQRIWFYSDNGASYNIEKIDLESVFYLPTYGKHYDDPKPTSVDPVEGTYGRLFNVIGNIGCAYTPHSIKFTISTTGKFVSQSDPTKYRNFYIAFKPRATLTSGDKDYNYIVSNPVYDSESGRWTNTITAATLTDRVQNTKATGSVTIISPAMPRNPNNSQYGIISDPENSYQEQASRWYLDMCICLDELTAEDLGHLAPGNDYLAIITFEWECTDPECDDADHPIPHHGSFTFALNGYFDESATNAKVFLSVKPDPLSMDLDLVAIANQATNPGKTKIADVDFYAIPVKNYSWDSKVSLFLSSSPVYNNKAQATPFKLTNASNGFYIPYTVEVVDAYGNKTTFDGTDFWKKTEDGGLKTINLTPSMQTVTNKNGDKVMSIAFNGSVYIQLEHDNNNIVYAYGDMKQYLGNEFVGTTPVEVNINEGTVVINNETILYHNVSGVFTSDIYYYIVYN